MKIRTSIFFLLTLVYLAIAAGQNAHARTIAVTSTADDGPGSLRQALVLASNGDTINITARGTVTLTSGELIVNKSVTIRGPGAVNMSVSGNAASRVFQITPNTSVTISGLTITNGRAATDLSNFPANAGGGIYSDHAQLTVDNCTLSGNSARFGGGIFSNARDGGNASLTVNDSTLTGNSAIRAGGGILSGGGFFNTGPAGNSSVTVNNSVISGNSAESAGGGILNDGFAGTATLAISNSIISGNNAANNFNSYAAGGGIYNNGDSGVATAMLTNCTLSDNSAHSDGGAVFNDGINSITAGIANMSLNNCTISGNLIGTGQGAGSGGHGGGIFSLGTANLTLTGSVVTGNSAGGEEAAGIGGGIYFQGHTADGSATLTLTSCVVNNNSGSDIGGIGIKEAVAVLTDTEISGNSTNGLGGGIGGGIDIDSGLGFSGVSQVSLTNCSVRANSAGSGGGISNTGLKLDLMNCTVSDNSADAGGGILNGNSSNAQDSTTVSLENSTVSGNSANAVGGGIYNAGATFGFDTRAAIVTLTNSTLTGNSAAFGGGILNVSIGDSDFPAYGIVTIRNSTLSGNSAGFGGGILIDGEVGEAGGATLDITNTVLNAGVSGENIRTFAGAVTSHGYNLSSDAAGGDGTTGPGGLLNAPGDIRNTNPLLGPLQDNGGPTMTHALLLHSPAIDAGDPNFNPYAFDPPLLYDQRDGPGFPRVVNGGVDIGAFESRHP